MGKKPVIFTVSFVLPDGATVEDAKAYVEDAVATWHGQCQPPWAYDGEAPGDPMFGLDSDTVKVRWRGMHD